MSDVVGAPSGAKKAPQAGDVSRAVVPESGGVGRLDKEEYFACSQAILRLYVMGYLTEVEKNRARKRLIMNPPRVMASTAPPPESTAPASSPVPDA